MHARQHTFYGVFRWKRGLAAALTGALVALPVYSLDVTPERIEFDKMDGITEIAVTHDGNPVVADDITAIKLMASDHDYEHMLNISKADGKIVLQPSKDLEIGTYELQIETVHGNAVIDVSAPLDGLSDSLESRAERLDMSVEELKSRLGMAEVIGKEYVDLNLAKVHYVGQTISIPIKRTPGRTYIWSVNGETIQLDSNDGPVTYTFQTPGIHDFTYTEMDGDTVIARAYGATNVVAQPSVRRKVEAGTVVNFRGPAGFAQYEWLVNGQAYPGGEVLSYQFTEPGQHVVKVRGFTPAAAGVPVAFREVSYAVTVTPIFPS